MQASSWNQFPTEENPDALYKFISMHLGVSADKVTINRTTYSLLDWLGDLGGLTDALFLILNFMLSPFRSFNLKSALFKRLIDQPQPHDRSKES